MTDLQELVSDVSLLFLDEPTSGLDAYAAESLISNMSLVVRQRNLACVMTIHQPSWSIFTKLDRVMLLARGGIYYDGPPRDAVAWFEGLGYEVPEGMNPADYFISITENAEDSEDRIKRVEELLNKWAEQQKSPGKLASVKENPTVPVMRMDSAQTIAPQHQGGRTQQEQDKVRTRWPTPWIDEFRILFIRAARESVSPRMRHGERELKAVAGQDDADRHGRTDRLPSTHHRCGLCLWSAGETAHSQASAFSD
jgi:hypothetical protein